MHRAATEQAARVAAGKRMLEIRGNRKRFESFVGELLGKNAAEALAKFRARKGTGIAFEIKTEEFQAVGLGVAETLDGKRQPFLGMISDRQDAAREVAALRPQMKQRLFAGASYFPGKSGNRGYVTPVFADFHGSRGYEFAQTSFQLGSEFHGVSIDEIRCLRTTVFII